MPARGASLLGTAISIGVHPPWPSSPLLARPQVSSPPSEASAAVWLPPQLAATSEGAGAWAWAWARPSVGEAAEPAQARPERFGSFGSGFDADAGAVTAGTTPPPSPRPIEAADDDVGGWSHPAGSTGTGTGDSS